MTDKNLTMVFSSKAEGDLAKPLHEVSKAAEEAAKQEKKYQELLRGRVEGHHLQRRLESDLSRLGIGSRGEREQRERQQHAILAARGAASLDLGGVAKGLGGMALGAGAAGMAGLAFEGLVLGAEKAARGIEVLNNSTLNAGQKMDKLAAEFIPGAKAAIALRQALTGVNESLRRLERGYQFASARQAGASEVERAELGRQAEIGGIAARAGALGRYARKLVDHPPEGAVLPRGTVAEEIAYQNRQKLLPFQYAEGRAKAEASAAKQAFNESQKRLADLQREQRGLLKERGEYTEESLGQRERRVLGRSFHYGVGTGMMGALHQEAVDARLDPSIHSGDAHHVGINKAAYDAAIAIEKVERSRARIEDELNRQKQLGLSLAEKEAAVRKAQIGMAQAELQILQGKEQRSAGLAGKIGRMTPGEQALTLQSLRMARKGGLMALPPQLRQHVENILPEFAQKEYEKAAPTSALWKEIAQTAGQEYVSGDFAGMRKTIQEKTANIEVKVILNEEQMAQKTANALGPVLKELVEQIKIANENKIQGLQRGALMHNANQ